MERAVPLENYVDGQVFNANDYNPGTVVILREEILTGSPDRLDVDPKDLEGQPLPVRPFDVSPSFGDTSTTETITDGSITYFTAAWWGIVVASKKRPNTLHTASTGLTYRKPEGGVFIALPWLLETPTPIELGATKHYAEEHTKTERLHRINVLDVVAYGDIQRQENKLESLAAKFALGHGYS
jgi:hypothetical protein